MTPTDEEELARWIAEIVASPAWNRGRARAEADLARALEEEETTK